MHVTEPPPPTSPEVADACRRAGLPYRADDRHDGMNAAAVGIAPRASSRAAEAAYDLLTALQRQLELASTLYGPALAAPMVATAAELHQSLETWRGEIWEGERLRDRLERSLDRAHDQVTEVAGERDRARDVAALLIEEALAAEDDPRSRLRCTACTTTWGPIEPALPRTCPRCCSVDVVVVAHAAVDQPLLSLAGATGIAYGRIDAVPGLALPIGFDVQLDERLGPDVLEVRGANAIRRCLACGTDWPVVDENTPRTCPACTPPPLVTPADTSGCAGAMACALCLIPIGQPHLRSCSQVNR